MAKKRSKLGEIVLTTVVTAGVLGAGAYELGLKPVLNRKAVNNYSETEVVEAPFDCTGYNSLARDLVETNPHLERVPIWRVVEEIRELNPKVKTNNIRPGQEIVFPKYDLE